MRKREGKLWAARLLIGVVLFVNLQCAFMFLWAPRACAPGFEVQGIGGDVMVRGLGILFLMWNVPYAVAVWHPGRHRVSLLEAICMQGLGLLGETLLLISLPQGHLPLRATALRFMLFDGLGLGLLCLAFVLSKDEGGPWR